MIDKKEVQHIAKLARLHLKQEEIEKMEKELSLILDYFNLLKDVNVDNVKVSFGSINTQENLSIKETTREDSVIKGDNTKEIIELIPEKKNGFVKVKSIFNK
jgi:aspartyl-tRNA(Asn)/glutamyl-tRNA(Gln) amidotransferase subunit C